MKALSTPLMSAVTAAVLLLVAAPAIGAEPARGSAGIHSFYLGTGLGVANTKDDVRFRDLGNVSLDDDSTAYKIFAGYRVTENLGVEGGYRNFGEADAGPFSLKTDGFDVSAVGFLPVGPVELFAKGGIIFWDTNGRGPVPDASGENLMYGIGGQVHITSLFFRLESEWFDMDFPEDAQMITGSVGWSF
jgi:OOP family OmpA-OmpF porin